MADKVVKKKFSELTLEEKAEFYASKARKIKAQLTKEDRRDRTRWLVLLGAWNWGDASTNPETAQKVLNFFEKHRSNVRPGDLKDFEKAIVHLKGVASSKAEKKAPELKLETK